MKWISAAGLLGVVLIVLSIPVSVSLSEILEKRFPPDPVIPPEVYGIIVLGGDLEYQASAASPAGYIMRSARITTAILLAKRFPNVRIVVSGAYKEAEDGRDMLMAGGISPARISSECQSKTTWENAVYTRGLIGGEFSRPWILITSSVHMPRAIGAFRQVGFDVIGVPAGQEPPQILAQISFREGLALLYYRITGRSNALLPSPSG
jgi:uncharacterized SAM-binding protein YcdF (DUF218 family)